MSNFRELQDTVFKNVDPEVKQTSFDQSIFHNFLQKISKSYVRILIHDLGGWLDESMDGTIQLKRQINQLILTSLALLGMNIIH